MALTYKHLFLLRPRPRPWPCSPRLEITEMAEHYLHASFVYCVKCIDRNATDNHLEPPPLCTQTRGRCFVVAVLAGTAGYVPSLLWTFLLAYCSHICYKYSQMQVTTLHLRYFHFHLRKIKDIFLFQILFFMICLRSLDYVSHHQGSFFQFDGEFVPIIITRVIKLQDGLMELS